MGYQYRNGFQSSVAQLCVSPMPAAGRFNARWVPTVIVLLVAKIDERIDCGLQFTRRFGRLCERQIHVSDQIEVGWSAQAKLAGSHCFQAGEYRRSVTTFPSKPL